MKVFSCKDVYVTLRDYKRRSHQEPVGVISPLALKLSCGELLTVPKIPDISDPCNALAGALGRFGRFVAAPQLNVVFAFKEYVRRIKHIFPQLTVRTRSVEDHLFLSHYTRGYKRELVREYNRLPVQKDYVTDGFVKNEGWEEYKIPRLIFAITERMKLLLGPLCSEIDKSVFNTGFFMKGMDPRHWPALLGQEFPGEVWCSDFSAMESIHLGHFSWAVLHVIMHIIRPITTSQERRMFAKEYSGQHKTDGDGFTMVTEGGLESGKPQTSLVNGLLNFLIMTFLRVYKDGVSADDIVSFTRSNPSRFEGDDGVTGPGLFLRENIMGLGLHNGKDQILKLERFDSITESSFCGNVVSRNSILCDPRKVLRNFFVLDPKYKSSRDGKLLALTRAKALSYKYNYQACPIVTPLVDRILDLTRGIDVQSCIAEQTEWRYRNLREACRMRVWMEKVPILPESRVAIEKLYGIPLTEQARFEEFIRSYRVGDVCPDFFFLPRELDHQLAYTGHERRRERITGSMSEVLRKFGVRERSKRVLKVREPSPLDTINPRLFD